MRRTWLGLAMVGLAALGTVAAWAADQGEEQRELAAKVERIAAALDARPELVAAAREAQTELPELPDKAVSRIDKNLFQVIGRAYLWDSSFLSDGTPLTVVVAEVRRPIVQDAYVACIGSLAAPCRATGRRGFDGYLLSSADDEFLYLLIATKVKK